MNEILSIIQTFGFPIAVCVICFWYINKINDDHKSEVSALTDAIHEIRVVLQQLMDKLGG